jgi:hypothetical protein
MYSWTLLRLNPASQARFVAYANDRHPDIPLYFPVYHRLSRPHGSRKAKSVAKPVYPGYVFARINTRESHRLVTLPVKARFIKLRLTQDEDITISLIPDATIAQLRQLEERNLLVQEVHKANPFKPGVKVVVHMPVADIQATITRIAGQKVTVETPIGLMVIPATSITLAPQPVIS